MGAQVDEMVMIRQDAEVEPITQAVSVEDTGDVTFWATGVDKQKTPNLRGLIFDWDKPEDVDVSPVESNGVLLFFHNDYYLPIGKIEKIAVNSKRVRFQCRIPSYADVEGMEDWEAFLAPVRQLIVDGYMKAVSIGFYIIEAIEAEAGEEVTDPWGRRSVRPITVKKLKIVELSVCAVGAHQSALIEQSAVPKEFASMIRTVKDAEADGELYRLSMDEMDGALRMSITRPGEAHPDDDKRQQDEESWKAIPYSRHGDKPKAKESAPWDGPAETKAAEPDQLKVMCVLENREALDKKSGYKGPHHHKNGKVNWRACAQLMAVIFGARGGFKGVSGEAKKGAYNHDAKHYKQFDKEVPPFKQDYSPEELEQMHEAGLILIPGKEEPMLEPQPGGDPDASLSARKARLCCEIEADLDLMVEALRLKVRKSVGELITDDEIVDNSPHQWVEPEPAVTPGPDQNVPVDEQPSVPVPQLDEKAIRSIVSGCLASPELAQERQALVRVQVNKKKGKSSA